MTVDELVKARVLLEHRDIVAMLRQLMVSKHLKIKNLAGANKAALRY